MTAPRKRKLRRYRVHGLVVGGKYLGEYEAISREEAVEMALNEHGGPVGLCHHCSDECSELTIEEATAELLEW